MMEPNLFPPGLDLVDLDLELTGYRQFISCWVYQHPAVTFVVDPGPRSTTVKLLSELARLGVRSLDLVLLTHIHLDHAGGTAQILEAFPQAKVFCHPGGVPHLVKPAWLWQGSRRTIGEVAEHYGEPKPVAPDRFADESLLLSRGIRVLPTPGHASHHLSFLLDEILFAGEAIATIHQLGGDSAYLRPATPPTFLPKVFLDSLLRLEALEQEPRLTAIGHHGLLPGARSWCRLAREQILLWLDVVKDMRKQGNLDLDAVFERLLQVDRNFGQGRFQELPPDIQARERYYVNNSLRGIVQSLETATTGGDS